MEFVLEVSQSGDGVVRRYPSRQRLGDGVISQSAQDRLPGVLDERQRGAAVPGHADRPGRVQIFQGDKKVAQEKSTVAGYPRPRLCNPCFALVLM